MNFPASGMTMLRPWVDRTDFRREHVQRVSRIFKHHTIACGGGGGIEVDTALRSLPGAGCAGNTGSSNIHAGGEKRLRSHAVQEKQVRHGICTTAHNMFQKESLRNRFLGWFKQARLKRARFAPWLFADSSSRKSMHRRFKHHRLNHNHLL